MEPSSKVFCTTQENWLLDEGQSNLESFEKHGAGSLCPLYFNKKMYNCRITISIKPSLSAHYLTNGLRLSQFLGTKTTEANKSLKTDANGVH